MSTMVFFVVFIIFVASLFYRRAAARLPLPPGPTGSLLLGIKSQLPTSEPWKQYFKWGEEFGGRLLSFRVYNRRILVLNHLSAVQDLLERRGHIYSDRPKLWMHHEICGRGLSVFNISSLSPRHKKYRRLLQSGLSGRAIQNYLPVIESEILNLIEGFVSNPKEYEQHIRRNTTAVIMKVTYGYTVKENDPFISVAAESAKINDLATASGRWMVDYIPILRFVPSFFPGASWKRQGEAWNRQLDSLSGVTMSWVKQRIASGDFVDSFTSRLLIPDGKTMVDPEEEDIIKWCAGGLYAGAALDTTVAALISFVLLMALHPDIQEQGQREIEDIVGNARLPCASEVHRFTYLAAVMKELLRYAPVGNLALPHKAIQDDEYDGYRIPKDTTVLANVWAIMHDPSIYPQPFTFQPQRFLTGEQPDPRHFSYGFGHRRCPGSQFAETTLLFTMASIIAKFVITLPTGKDGRKVVPIVEFTTGITSHIKPFHIVITPRG